MTSTTTPTPESTDFDLRKEELQLAKDKLKLEQATLAFEFAKYGFGGTLTGAIVGMALVFGLACLGAFAKYQIGWELVGMMFIILIGSIFFGSLSLWKLPTFVARFQKLFELNVSENTSKKDEPKDDQVA